jgi:hypothetical protein
MNTPRLSALMVGFERLRPALRKALAVIWALGAAVQAFSIEGVPLWPAALLVATMVGYLIWPRQFRPILVSAVILFVGGLVVFAHVYFRTILMVPVIAFTGLAIVGMLLTFYGRGPAAFILGLTLSLASALAYPENPFHTSARSEPECSARVDAIEQRLSPFVAQAFLRPPGLRLPEKPAWAAIQDAHYRVEIGARGKVFGRPLPNDRGGAAAELRRRVIGLSDGGKPLTIFLAADVEQTTSEIAAILPDLPFVSVWILGIKGPGPLGPPPPGAQAFASAFEATNHDSERSRMVGLEFSRRLGACAPAAKRAVLVSKVPPGQQAQFLVAGVSQGLRECQCGYVDLEALEYLMAVAMGLPTHEYSARQIPRDSNGALMIPRDSTLLFGQWVASL